jgi:TRAP-type mannitol/chloroaromatic compound transport system substrate-binding protein
MTKARRRDVLLSASAAVASAGSLPAPAVAQGLRELKMVTSWPANSLGMQTSADRLAASITALSERRIRITVYPADTPVRAYEVFDAVGAGAADMYHTGEGVFEDKTQALNFFCGTVPYGFTADELCAWIAFGGGQTLWDEVDAQFNIKPLVATNSGVQMGGWFNKEINHPESFKGLRYRAAAQAEVTRSLAQFNHENVKALKLLRAEERIKILRFNDELIKTFGKLSKEVLADAAAKDALTRKVYDSYVSFRAGVMDSGELSETGYRDTRRLALG